MSGVTILLSDNRGVYIPQNFAEGFMPHYWGLEDNNEDIKTLRKGPTSENEFYWDAWDRIIMSARHTDPDGNVWLLSQDGDLFAYCEALMTTEEKVEFFGWADDESGDV